MSRKQTRRSISVSMESYERLQAYVKANGQTGSGLVEGLLRGFFDMPEVKQKEMIAPIPRFQRQVGPRERKVVISTPLLEQNGDWTVSGPPELTGIGVAGPPGRVVTVKNVAQARAVFGKTKEEAEVDKKTTVLADMTTKIFTF